MKQSLVFEWCSTPAWFHQSQKTLPNAIRDECMITKVDQKKNQHTCRCRGPHTCKRDAIASEVSLLRSECQRLMDRFSVPDEYFWHVEGPANPPCPKEPRLVGLGVST